MVTAVKRIIVPFHGAASGVEDLTWGQREIWTAMVTQRSWLPIVAIRTTPPRTTVADVEAELRACAVRYDSMRTRVRFDRTGEPRQVVAEAAEFGLDVFEAGGADPADIAAEVADQYRNADHDHVRDWPVRTAVVLHRGEASHVVSVFCHLVMDAHGRAMLLRDLAGPDRGPGHGLQPLQLARWERTDEARQASAVSLAHWERLLREIPARRFPPSNDPRQPRYWEAEFRSQAMHLALRRMSPETGGSTALLLAVFAVALARVTGSNPVVAQVVVSNRFRTPLADVLAPVNQTGLWVVEAADTTFEEVFARSRRRAMATYKYAYYDPRHRAELIDRVSRERGEDVDVGCFFNDRRLNPAVNPAGAVPEVEAIQAARLHTTFAWRTRTDTPNERLFIHVEDDPDAIRLTAWTDTHHLAPDDLAAVLREMETVAVSAAIEPTVITGQPSAHPLPTGPLP
jgi:hypothetical protein